jgi:hypothetical protein
VSQRFTLTVVQSPFITSVNSAAFVFDEANSFRVTASDLFVPFITFSGILPSGVKFVNERNGTALLSGKPTVHGSFVFTLTDGTLPPAIQTFDLTVS